MPGTPPVPLARPLALRLTTVVVAAAVVLGVAPGAWANEHAAPELASSPDSSSPFGDPPPVVTVPADHVAAAVAFWTPERLAEADRTTADADRETSGAVATGTDAAADTLATSLAAAPVSRAVRVAPVPHVGRLYVLNANHTYQTCSANAVASTNGLTVATAAHCVDDHGSLHQSMVFIPAFEDERMPYGEWPVTAYALPTGWTGVYAPQSDTAFLEVGSPTGRTLAQTVGASPVEFGRPRNLPTTIYGYPGLPPYDDEHPFLCRGKAVPTDDDGGQAVACSMNEGASGGPWFDGDSADAPQYSVSTNRSLDSTQLYAPVWGPVIRAAYRAVEAR